MNLCHALQTDTKIQFPSQLCDEIAKDITEVFQKLKKRVDNEERKGRKTLNFISINLI